MYHRQCPGQQADLAYLEGLASMQRLAHQEPTKATFQAIGTTPRDTEATHSACSGTARQPHHPERTIQDLTATGNPSADTEESKELESMTISSAEILRAWTRGRVVILEHTRMRESNLTAQRLVSAASQICKVLNSVWHSYHTCHPHRPFGTSHIIPGSTQVSESRSTRPALSRTHRSHNGQRWTSRILPRIYNTVHQRCALAHHPFSWGGSTQVLKARMSPEASCIGQVSPLAQ